MPTRSPRCRWTVEGYAHVRYGRLGGKRVPCQAHCPHRHPAHPASTFIPIPAFARLRLRECCTCGHGLTIDGECGAASSSLHWYRVSSFLLHPDPGVPQARCSSSGMPRNAYGSPWHTRCLRSACPPSSLTAKPAVLAMLGGIGAVRLGHTLSALRRPALPSITAQ